MRYFVLLVLSTVVAHQSFASQCKVVCNEKSEYAGTVSELSVGPLFNLALASATHPGDTWGGKSRRCEVLKNTTEVFFTNKISDIECIQGGVTFSNDTNVRVPPLMNRWDKKVVKQDAAISEMLQQCSVI